MKVKHSRHKTVIQKLIWKNNIKITFLQFVIVALLIAPVAADEAYPKPAYPAHPPAYHKTYDYVSLVISMKSIASKLDD